MALAQGAMFFSKDYPDFMKRLKTKFHRQILNNITIYIFPLICIVSWIFRAYVLATVNFPRMTMLNFHEYFFANLSANPRQRRIKKPKSITVTTLTIMRRPKIHQNF
jgi:hypothetical protein